MPRFYGRVKITRKVTIRPRITRRPTRSTVRVVFCPRCGSSRTGYSPGSSFLCSCGHRVRVV